MISDLFRFHFIGKRSRSQIGLNREKLSCSKEVGSSIHSSKNKLKLRKLNPILSLDQKSKDKVKSIA